MTTPLPEDPPALETDDRFPSGPWKGYFLQPGSSNEFRMELSLEFQNGKMTGEGMDCVGAFLIRGQYDVDEGRCDWIKQYVGRHRVHYAGYNEGRGIWGLWDIPGVWTGGFHIWPEGMADPTAQCEAKSADLRASAPFESEAPASLQPSGFHTGLSHPREFCLPLPSAPSAPCPERGVPLVIPGGVTYHHFIWKTVPPVR